MQKPKILITKNILPERLTHFSKFLDITSKPFIQIDFPEQFILESILNDQHFDAIAFTSQNAVRAIEIELQNDTIQRQLTNTKIFAVGSKTSRLLSKFKLQSDVPIIQDAENMAYLIQNDTSVKSLLYLKGNLSSEMFSEMILDSGIQLKEIIVYNTRLLAQKIIDMESFDGFVFYSPSAVDSFKNQYPMLIDKSFFGIGKRTAKRLNKYGIKNVIIPDTPETNDLFLMVKEHFIDGRN